MATNPRPTNPTDTDQLDSSLPQSGKGETIDRELHARAAANTLPEGILTINDDGLIESASTAAQRVFGRSADEMIGQPLGLLLSPYDASDIASLLASLHTEEHLGNGEVRGRRKDGSLFPIDLALSRLQLGDRQLFAVLVRDTAERTRLEKELQEISTHEQRRLGRELHDGLGQELTGLSYLAKNLQRRLEARSLPEAKAAADLTAGLQHAIGQVQTIAKAILPSQVDADALVPALHALAASTAERYAVSCQVHADPAARVPSNYKAVHLYRIAQEAVHNALKHGGAVRIVIELSGSSDHTILTITDDGEGFRTAPQNSSGMGIKIMQYRARLIGGSLDVNPIDSGGTQVVCSVYQDDRHE